MSDGHNNLASKLRPLLELANLREGDIAGEAFLSRWPDMFDTFPELAGEPLRWPDGEPVRGPRPSTNPPENVPPFYNLFELRSRLQSAWRGDDKTMTFLLTRPKRRAAGEWIEQVAPSWRKGGLTYQPTTKFQALAYLLLTNSNLAKVCGNPECPAPYFIADRAIQRYCTAKCAGVFQRQSKLAWWKREGSKRRAKKKSKRAKR